MAVRYLQVSVLFCCLSLAVSDWESLYEDLEHAEDLHGVLLNTLREPARTLYEDLVEQDDDGQLTDASVHCAMCRGATSYINTSKRLGLGYWDVRDFIVNVCQSMFNSTLSNGTRRYDLMCEGMMDNYVPHYWYILDVGGFTPKKACQGIHFCEPDIGIQQITRQVVSKKHALTTRQQKPTARKERQHSLRLDDAIKVVHLSDIHFDHEYSTGAATDCGLYLCCRDKYDGEGKARPWGEYTCNIPKRTVSLFLQEIAQMQKQPDMVLYTGDTPPHHMWEETQEKQLNYSQVLAQLFEEELPNTRVYANIGNHEMFPTNLYYLDRPEIQELNVNLAEWWQSMSGFEDYQMQTMKDGGYFTMVTQPGLRVVSYNTMYRMANNFYSLISGDHPAYLHMQTFLNTTFAEARRQNEKVILIGHAPPGYSTTVDFSDWLSRLVLDYADLLVLHVYGHTHRDFFTLYTDEDHVARSVHLVTPSVSTLTNRNPTARVYWLDPATFELLDYDHYWMDMSNTSDDSAPAIRHLYSPRAAYDMPDLSAASWQQLANRMEVDDNLLQDFYWNFETGRVDDEDMGCDDDCRRERLCEIRHVNYENIVACNRQMR